MLKLVAVGCFLGPRGGFHPTAVTLPTVIMSEKRLEEEKRKKTQLQNYEGAHIYTPSGLSGVEL